MKRILRKAILFLAAVAVLAPCLSSCGKRDDGVSGKTYVWEKEGAGGDFSIKIKGDGTYSYYAGFLSSYIGYGTWDLKDGILTMTESPDLYDFVFRFQVKEGELVYIAEGSSGFMYVNVADGDRFILSDEAPFPNVDINP